MKKGFWVSLLAGAAAIAAAAIAVTAFVRKKSKALSEHLDYDPDDYFENDDECCDCHDCCGEETTAEDEEADEEEETLPLHRKKSLLQTRPTKKSLPDPMKKATPNKKENLTVPVDPIRRDRFFSYAKIPCRTFIRQGISFFSQSWKKRGSFSR